MLNTEPDEVVIGKVDTKIWHRYCESGVQRDKFDAGVSDGNPGS